MSLGHLICQKIRECFNPSPKKKKKKKKKKKQHGVRLTYKGHRNQPERFLNGQN